MAKRHKLVRAMRADFAINFRIAEIVQVEKKRKIRLSADRRGPLDDL